MMNQNPTATERWEIQKEKLKIMFQNLCDDDLRFDYEHKEDMMPGLETKLGKTREEMNELLEQLGHF